MFVKQAYEKRLKKQEEQFTRLLATKKSRQPKIGSVRNDKINYDKDEQFFSKEDIPQYAKTIKEEVKNLVDPDHLGLRKKPWNGSVSVPKNMEKQETHEQKLLKIKLGFTDNPAPKTRDPVIYTGTETRNDYTNWNVSTEINKLEIRANLYRTTNSAMQNTKLKEDRFLSTYNNPLAKTINFIEADKQKVQNEAELRNRLREQYVFNNPTASEEKIRAAVHRLACETVIKEKKDDIAAQAMKTDFKANLSMSQQSRISVEWSHTGIWQRFGAVSGDEENFAWSCCMNEDRNSRGCNHSVRDKNRWNLSSFNNN